mmetsp:Transcript_24685/g.39627  ORF Transcript_24685/g.39627 Transcript_24685/m.39627 type:complete len:150 (-) Transcript_24685:93-542(-)
MLLQSDYSVSDRIESVQILQYRYHYTNYTEETRIVADTTSPTIAPSFRYWHRDSLSHFLPELSHSTPGFKDFLKRANLWSSKKKRKKQRKRRKVEAQNNFAVSVLHKIRKVSRTRIESMLRHEQIVWAALLTTVLAQLLFGRRPSSQCS